MKKIIGQRIRELRLHKNIGLRELARGVNMSPAMLSDIELGKKCPSLKNYFKLAIALQFDIKEHLREIVMTKSIS